MAPSKELFNNFVTACVKNYSPDPNSSINKSLLGFRGRCIFKQYIPNKPSKYGIKIFALIGSQSLYSIKPIVYTEREIHSSQKNTNLSVPTKVVLDIVDCISRKNRNITINNYYTFLPLANELQKQGLILVRTITKNKRCIPQLFT